MAAFVVFALVNLLGPSIALAVPRAVARLLLGPVAVVIALAGWSWRRS